MLKTSLSASLLLGASLIVLAATAASADDLRLASTIAKVTVYPSGATVVRTVPVNLPAGASTVVIDDLPLEMEADSLKVEGSSDHAFAIASVEARVVPADETADPQRVALNDEIQGIEDKLGGIADRLDALDARKRFLEQLIESAPTGFGKALAEGTGNIEQWNTAAATIGDGLAAVADATRAAHVEERQLNVQLVDRRKALAELPELTEHQTVRIAVAADAAATGTLSISYHTASARWLPTYDAQLTTGEGGTTPSLTIVRRADVTQATGEDWSGVQLTFLRRRHSGERRRRRSIHTSSGSTIRTPTPNRTRRWRRLPHRDWRSTRQAMPRGHWKRRNRRRSSRPRPISATSAPSTRCRALSRSIAGRARVRCRSQPRPRLRRSRYERRRCCRRPRICRLTSCRRPEPRCSPARLRCSATAPSSATARCRSPMPARSSTSASASTTACM